MISIVICTHNRPDDLQLCLEALHPQASVDRCEIVVVDSGSHEAASIRNVVCRFAGVRLVRVHEAGLSIARNAGLESTSSEWIAFIDDDAIASSDWVENACRLIAIAPEKCAIIGGDVAPQYPGGSSPQIGWRWKQLLSLVSQPDESFGAASVAVCGANVIYRREPLTAVGGFPSSLGRIGARLLSGEEKLVQEVLIAQGWNVARSNRLSVRHRIDPQRLNRSWAINRAHWDGISDERVLRLIGQPTSTLEILIILMRTLGLSILYGSNDTGKEYFIRFWYNLGRAKEWAYDRVRFNRHRS